VSTNQTTIPFIACKGKTTNDVAEGSPVILMLDFTHPCMHGVQFAEEEVIQWVTLKDMHTIKMEEK